MVPAQTGSIEGTHPPMDFQPTASGAVMKSLTVYTLSIAALIAAAIAIAGCAATRPGAAHVVQAQAATAQASPMSTPF